jgi:hypothetical protein
MMIPMDCGDGGHQAPRWMTQDCMYDPLILCCQEFDSDDQLAEYLVRLYAFATCDPEQAAIAPF